MILFKKRVSLCLNHIIVKAFAGTIVLVVCEGVS